MRFFLLSLIVSVIVFGQSCRPYNIDREIRQADTLQSMIEQAENTLIVDYDAIKTRQDSITIKLQYLKEHENLIPDKGVEFQFLMSEYQAIRKNYSKFIDTYKSLEYQNQEHKERIATLKKDLIEKNISPEKFNEYYKQERKIIKDHLENVKKVIGEVVYIENNYKRANEKVNRIYRGIRNKIEE